jgi:hypothetical protein
VLFLGCGGAPKNEAMSGPGLRNAHAMVYDNGTECVYMFGGDNGSGALNDLWKLEGDWSAVALAHRPPARVFGCMAQVPALNGLLLFGGSRELMPDTVVPEILLGDTWLFAHGAWRELEVPAGPCARSEACMTHDAGTGRTVLFGGYCVRDGVLVPLCDTWVYDSKGWQQLRTPGPSARFGAAMTYDSGKQAVLLYGGNELIDGEYGASDETWMLVGDAWTRIDSGMNEGGRYNSAMCYDVTAGHAVRCCGWDGAGRVADAWTLAGSEWRRMNAVAGPSARNHTTMVHDAAHGRCLLYGGHDGERVFGDGWELRDGRWKMLRR